MAIPHTNREGWLHALGEGLRPLFLTAGIPLRDAFHVTVGFPSTRATSRSKRRIGECWSHERSNDGKGHIFISPFLTDPVEVAGVLVHELVHDAIGTDKKHGPAFKRAMGLVGLEGKPTATHAGAELVVTLQTLLDGLEPYPHAGLNLEASPEKKQSTRGLKGICEGCGYTIRITRKWIDVGMPFCGSPECDMRRLVPDMLSFNDAPKEEK